MEFEIQQTEETKINKKAHATNSGNWVDSQVKAGLEICKNFHKIN